MPMKTVHIIGGGLFSPVRSHLALCAPAFGTSARMIHGLCAEAGLPASLHLTKMADPQGSNLVTNADVAALVDELLEAETTGGLVLNAALCDFDGQIGETVSGFHAPRLKSREGATSIAIEPADKVIGRVREKRPDIILVGFKTTAGDDVAEQFARARAQVLESGSTFVVANDTVTRQNLLVSNHATNLADIPPATTDRKTVFRALVENMRSRLDAKPL